ncbi:hypothetical protein XO10_04755 [Marinitoga sp. 1135]|uniref:Uncharacterized protein n=1 Tax=Marinitoga piezophila (strain DSM 14283 / JCM 11233 / KA3) TaxID=443254 RepID=H2J7Q7_MARPK|nr:MULTISPECIES: hypothetical protein [Marinitoga]AEX85398.1 hypothetical protein Marpi_0986 [Marinitoga piezophila KA3]APT75873.1 hypothetical protein LN42_05400 [Marinitoga sp. 1137]NUU95592.1 hypothetical protein [Marinitoga sp. 1135]NUU97528.1 hypothetical protein [Marinitoga sp. 1138]
MFKTTRDLNMYIKLEQKHIIHILDKLRENNVFSKLFALGANPVIAFSEEDKEKVVKILKNEEIEYNIIKTQKDIIEEMLTF